MEKLNLLWQAVNVAGELRDIARERRSYVFNTPEPTTFYLRAERASVSIRRWAQARIEVQLRLDAAFGWNVATDQDEAGVYVVAHRRRVIGGMSRALFEIALPQPTYLMLKLHQGKLILEDLDGTLQIPPPGTDEDRLRLLP
jgi:hypothetical protein